VAKLRKFDGIGTENWKANSRTLANRQRRKYQTEQRNKAKKEKKARIAARNKAERQFIAATKKAERESLSAAKKTEREHLAAAKKTERERLAAAKKAAKEREKALKAEQEARERHEASILKLNGLFLEHDLDTHINDFDLREIALKYIEENGIRIAVTTFKKLVLPFVEESLPAIYKSLYEEYLIEQSQLVYEFNLENTFHTLDVSNFDSNDLKLIRKHIEWESIIESEVDSWLSENFESDWISYVQTLDPHSTYETPEIELPGNLNNISELSRNIRIGFENVIPEAREKHYQLEKKEKTIKLRKLISGIISNSQKLQVKNTQFNEQFQRDLRL